MADHITKYDDIEQASSSVHDDSECAYTTRSGITPVDEEVIIVDAPELPPYTIEELNARIDEAEEEIARGEVLTEEEAEIEFERFLATL